MGFSIGALSFGSSRSRTASQSSSDSQSSAASRTTQQIFLEDLYSRLYSSATGAAEGVNTGGITSAANDLFDRGAGFIDLLESAAAPSFLAPTVSTTPGRLDGVAPISLDGSTVEAEIQQLQGDLGRLFREELNPAITSEAVGGNVLGGGRQGVAQGRAAEAVAREFTRGSTDIRARDIERNLAVQTQNQNAALTQLGIGASFDTALAELALNAEQFNAGLAVDADQASRGLTIEAATRGLDALTGQLGLAQSADLASLTPYVMLAQILSNPTVLTESLAASGSRSTSQSTSSGSSRSFNFGLGS